MNGDRARFRLRFPDVLVPPSICPVVRSSPSSPYFRADATQVATLYIDAAYSDGCERDWRLGHAHMC